MHDFYNIKEFACKHFYSWEEGEDFIWMKNEWHKFLPHLNNLEEVESFILTLSNFYEKFCGEAYFAKISDEDVKKYPWIIENPNPPTEEPEVIERITKFHDKTVEILLKVYGSPSEVLREFVSIAIDFEVPHPDSYKFIFDLCKEIYVEPELKLPF